MRIAAIAALVAILAAPAAAQNVYPDSGFEKTGEAGQARSGQRAAHLVVGAHSHWTALGGSVDVQPFARYRVTEWVRGSIGEGTLHAPYCYQWDSYEWSFLSAPALRPSGEWVRVETTFVSPTKTMFVHPLGAMDAGNVDVWVDDIVVEKIEEPAAAMAAIEAKQKPSDDELRLLARWYVAKGRAADAADLLGRVDGLARADIATVLARATRDLKARARFVKEVVANGGPTYHDGPQVLNEITRGYTEAQRLQLVVEGVLANPESERAVRSACTYAAALMGPQAYPCTLARRRANVAVVVGALKQVAAALAKGTPQAAELEAAMQTVSRKAAEIDAQARALGHCVLKIGDATVTAKTHAIAVPRKATPQEGYAGLELQVHLELVTGQVLPIVDEQELGKAHPIYVGNCQSPQAAKLRGSLAPLGLEGLRIHAAGPALMLAGGKRGVLYAVYTFLEDYLGCRWFTPDCQTWPKSGVIKIGAIDRTVKPALEYRAGDYPVLVPGQFAARLRMNGRVCTQSEEQGSIVGVNNLAHTFQFLCPPEQYFASHPEYFSLVGGKRQSGYAQLCLSNPEVLKIVIAAVRKQIRENPGQTVFSVSQNDTDMHCECDKCTAIANEEGSQAGPMIRFVNAVADDIKKDYPNVAIETLAYQYTRKPPAITKPRPNVIVCLCSIECCFVHPLGGDPFNASFVRDITGWSLICKRLWIWDYVINYAHSICPFPNLYVLKPNIRFFIEHGVRGIYEESCYYTKGSEMQELRNYIMGKTLWDPNYDTNKAIDEFCAAYYGAAGPFVRSYVKLIHDETQLDPKEHVMIYTHPRDYVTPKMIAEGKALFDQAEAAVKDDALLLHRVQVARLPILYAEITLAQSGAWVEKGDKLERAAADMSTLAEQFEKIARAEGVTMIREGGDDATLDAWLKTVPRRPAALPIERLKSGLLQLDVLPDLGGRIWRMSTAQGGQVLVTNGGPGAWDAANGGYEEYSTSEYHSPGWQEAYAVKDRSERAITLEADLTNGLRLTRRIELGEAKSVVSIASTVTNVSGAARTACLRVHPEFAVKDIASLQVRVRKPDGSWHVVALANPADPAAEKSMWLDGNDVPAGEWQIVDGAGKVLISDQLQRDQIGKCLLNWHGAKQRVNLELYSPEKPLAPGESITIEHSYTVGG